MSGRTSTPRDDEPERLREQKTEDPVLDELGRWFAAAPDTAGIDAAALARVARRLDGSAPSRRGLGRSGLLAAAVVIVASSAAATWGHAHPGAWPFASFTRRDATRALTAHGATAPPALPPRAVDPDATGARSATRVNAANGSAPVSANAANPTGASVTTPDTVSATPTPSAANARIVPPSDAPPLASAAASELARESAALARALTVLRREHDAPGALALLDRYATDFPAGVLRLEADVARVDANLALGDTASALALLNRMPLDSVGRGLELRLVRAELLATRDCKQADLDFERVLAAEPPPAFGERALFGRATCREKLGDTAGSRADFALYLQRFPDGRFAQAVRARRE